MTGTAFRVARPPDVAASEAAHRLFSRGAEFLKGAVAMDGLPPSDRIEVCFAGRSNVGKSTLINALVGRRNLARTSNTPGRTQEINFFTLGPEHHLVDLPGYGHAKAPAPVVAKWQDFLRAYLSGRPNLRRVFLLIDSRHGVKSADEPIMDLLDRSAVNFQAVMTKADKVKEKDLGSVLDRVRGSLGRHPAAHPEMIVTSSEKGVGIDSLRAAIATIDRLGR